MKRAILAFIAWVMVVPTAVAQNAWPGSYPEGPIWIGETLYWAEMYDNRVMAWAGQGDPEPFFQKAECGPTAIAPYRETDLIVLCHLGAALAHLDRNGQLIRMIRATPDGGTLTNPNDASSDGNGGVWFTDPGTFSANANATGKIFHLAPDGMLTRHATGLRYGNGIHTDLANQRLLVSEHLARRVLSYPLTTDGLGSPEVIIELDQLGLDRVRYAEAGPDGLEIGPDGTLWFAEYGAARLLGWQQGKGLVAALQVDAQFVTNIAFGPNGLAAMTGAKDNRYAPFPGATWVFPAEALTNAVITEDAQ